MEQIDSDEFWDLYWEVRLKELQNLGKREAILAISKLIRQISKTQGKPLRLFEPGCGEGQIIGPLLEAHADLCDSSASIGLDYLRESLQFARRTFPFITFIEGDFTNTKLLEKLGQFDIVMMINALHEVFSAGYTEELGEVDIPAAKQQAGKALSDASHCVCPGGYLVLFDGLEPTGDLRQPVRLHFLSRQALESFLTFTREYRPFRVSYETFSDPYTVEISLRDFTRYITKSIFLGKQLWQTEKLESYQFFNEEEFRSVFSWSGLEIQELRTLTVDDEKWRQSIEILTPRIDFPEEHILIIAKKQRS